MTSELPSWAARRGGTPDVGGPVEFAVRGLECDCRGVAAPDELTAVGVVAFVTSEA
jgi:hypothetical protein